MVDVQRFLLPQVNDYYSVVAFILQGRKGRNVAVFNAVGRIVYSAVGKLMAFYFNGVVNVGYGGAGKHGVRHFLVA